MSESNHSEHAKFVNGTAPSPHENFQSFHLSQYFFDKQLFFDPAAIIDYKRELLRDNPTLEKTANIQVGEASRMVLHGITSQAGRDGNRRISRLVNLRRHFGRWHYNDWFESLNTNSVANLMECNSASIIASSFNDQHWGFNQLNEDRTKDYDGR